MANGTKKVKPEKKVKVKGTKKVKGEVIKKVKGEGKMITTTGDGEIIGELENPEVLLVRLE